MKLPLALTVAAPAARPFARRLTGAGTVVLLQVGVVLLRPWPLALAVDHALSDGASTVSLPLLGELSASAVLILAALALVVLSVLIGGLDLLLEDLSEGTAERIGAVLRSQVFDHAMGRSLRWHDRMRSGELLSRLTTDVGRLLDAVVATTTTLVPDTAMLVGVLALVVSIDPVLAIVGLSVVPVLAVLSIWQRRGVRESQRVARQEAGRLTGVSADLLRNVRAIQAFGRFDLADAQFSRRNHDVLTAELDAVRVQARWAPVPELVLAVGTSLVLGVGGVHVLAGSLTVGGLLVVLAYLRDLYSPVRNLTRLSTVLAKAGASAARVHEVLACDEAVHESPDARPADRLESSVRFEQVRFGYEPGRPVLDGLDLEVRRGETVCLVGPSGSGKSTVLSLLLRLYDVDAGRITIDGVDLRSCTLDSLRSQFAYMPQDPWLLDATVAENIALGNPGSSREDVEAAGRRALVEEFLDRLPQGYDTLLGEAAARLSGGQRRRVALARATMSAAPVLMLDEPTTSLDDRSATHVLHAVANAALGRTTLVVTHDPRVAALADRVVPLAPVPASATPEPRMHTSQ